MTDTSSMRTRRFWSVVAQMAQDARRTFRMLRKSPVFAAVALVTMAIGIGANTAIFSLVNAVVLRPLGYPQPDRLMFLTTRVQGFDEFWVSSPEYFELTEISRSYSSIGAFRTGEANLSAADRPRRVKTADVNVDLLETLAVPPALGRWFSDEDAQAKAVPTVLLSNDIWRSAFAAGADIVGRRIDVDGVQREVVGVMPAGFDLLDRRIDVWLPLVLDRTNRQDWNRNTHILFLVGRLKDGVSPSEAQAELGALNANWGARVGVKGGHLIGTDGHAVQMEPVQDEIVGSARRVVWVLQAAVALVLLIACSNLASLLLARTDARRRELATRTALGASWWRLFAQFSAEGLVLAALGGLLGLGLAHAVVRGMVVVYGDSLPRVGDIGLDPVVLAFAAVVTLLTGLAFAAAPLIHLSGSRLNRTFSEDASRGVTVARHGMRRVLIATEVGLAVLLVSGAGLMLRTVANLTSVDAGFDRARQVTFAVGLPTARYGAFEARRQLYQQVLDRLSGTPGVERVAAMSGLPPLRQPTPIWTDIEGYTPLDRPVPVVDFYQTVTGGYFEAMGIPIVEGRGFEAGDRQGAPAVVVNEAFVRRFWAGANPLGRQLRSHFGGVSPWMTVVGVARDVKQGGVDQQAGTEVYFLLDQIPRLFPSWVNGEWSTGGMNIVLRSPLRMAALQPVITSALREADASLPIVGLREMEDVFRRSLTRPRMLMHLFSAFAIAALLLAAVGTYGVLAYLVVQQRREIGIRLALGAKPAEVLRRIMAQGLKPATTGLAAGLLATLALTRLMDALLFEVRPNDPLTLGAVAGGTIAVAVMACLAPAYRATRLDPVEALRE
jgi:predicted permease